MKTIKTLFLSAAALLLASSCSNDETYNAGFPTFSTASGHFYYFANPTPDTLYLESFGPWRINNETANNWCKLSLMQGYGYAFYPITITAEQNTTGQGREARYRIEDTAHPDKAYKQWAILQLATRGNGALGLARDVTAIEGTDGSNIQLTYDELHRPLSLSIQKDDATLSRLTISYNDAKATMTVNNGRGEMTSGYDLGYEPQLLRNSSDTICLNEMERYLSNTPSRYTFYIQDTRADGQQSYYSYLIDKMVYHPDSLHHADSLRYIGIDRNKNTEKILMKLSYSNADNRYQSVDANQLLLGVERCNPYMLLSMFRFARNSSIISKATTENEADEISVQTELNSDKSVSRLSVTRHGETITYTFKYAE